MRQNVASIDLRQPVLASPLRKRDEAPRGFRFDVPQPLARDSARA